MLSYSLLLQTCLKSIQIQFEIHIWYDMVVNCWTFFTGLFKDGSKKIIGSYSLSTTKAMNSLTIAPNNINTPTRPQILSGSAMYMKFIDSCCVQVHVRRVRRNQSSFHLISSSYQETFKIKSLKNISRLPQDNWKNFADLTTNSPNIRWKLWKSCWNWTMSHYRMLHHLYGASFLYPGVSIELPDS